MIRHFAATGIAAFLAISLSSFPVSAQTITVYSPPVLAPSITVPAGTPYSVWSPPVATTPTVPIQQSFSVPVQQSYSVPIQQSYSVPFQQSYSVPTQRSYSVPMTAAPAAASMQRSYSIPLTSTPVAVPVVAPTPQPVIVSPKVYVPGQPVRNILRAVTP